MKKAPRIITKMVNKIGEQLFNMLKSCDAINIDINRMLKDTDDYDVFWANVNKSHKDFIGGLEDE